VTWSRRSTSSMSLKQYFRGRLIWRILPKCMRYCEYDVLNAWRRSDSRDWMFFPGSYLVKMSWWESILNIFRKRDETDFKNCSRRRISISCWFRTELFIHAFKQ
jgi:hypothetical protein